MTTTVIEPKRAARTAGLSYVSDGMPGIQRRRCGRGFVYHDPDGKRVTDEKTLQRIQALAIPPAYRDVWICPLANGHLQATGFDEAGRKQYRYHEQWRECRALHNFDRLPQFAERLPALRRRVSQDLKQKRLDHRLVVACAVRLLDETLIRVGNQEYYETNGSHGLTTLRDRHIRFERGAARLRFVGKSGQRHEMALTEKRLLRVIRRCHELPGQHLFQFETADGGTGKILSTNVNAYLIETMGEGVSAKDFRTWGGTVLAAITLAAEAQRAEEEDRKQRIGAAIDQVAARLGNRPATCLKYYVHPKIIDTFHEGTLHEAMNASPRVDRPIPWTTLSAEEQAVLKLLQS